ncbi:MAG: class I SAM-dependent methyltransferase [Bryobacteraceae bacterium]|nr:class I SAM-dependent methyltransferase [Bryobacteraceae bacterium]
MKPYHWLAKYYDRIFLSSRLPWARAHVEILGSVLPHITSACDLACGTGATALDFARRRLRTYAVDLSPAMCRITADKARRAKLPVKVLRADMRTFRLPERVDLVTCEYDAVNHLPAREALADVAGSVFRALQPGGMFLFDVNTRVAFRRYWIATHCIEIPGAILIMRNGNAAAEDRAWSDLDWFIREGRTWRRRQERVEEVCWTDREIRSGLRAAGFRTVRAWDAAPFFKDGAAPIEPGCRTFYLARK